MSAKNKNQYDYESDGESLSSLESGGLTLFSINSFQSSVAKEKKLSQDVDRQEALSIPQIFTPSPTLSTAATEKEIEIAVYSECTISDPTKDIASQRKSCRRRVGFAALSILVIIVLLAVTLGIILSKKNDGPRNVSISQPGDYLANDTFASEIHKYVFGILVGYSDEQLLKDPTTPQGQAFLRLVLEEKKREEKSELLAGSGMTSLDQLKENFKEYSEPTRIVQRFALMIFFISTQLESWNVSEGWIDFVGNECSWYGIDNCQRVQNGIEVRKIDLSNNNLVGTIPQEICLLGDYLVELSLGHNKLTGSIPSCISNFNNLESIILNDNSLSGGLPAGLMHISSLTMVDFSENSLSGTLDVLIEGDKTVATNLQTFDVHSNFLTGSIPVEFLSMPKMTKFSTDMMDWINLVHT